jgi:phenylalanyl-tRNA synthetase beta chain
MPVVNVDPDELRELTDQRDKSEDDLLDDMFGLGLEFEGETEDGDLKVEFEPDRLDWLSIEGIARALRYYYCEDRGVAIPSTNDPEWTIEVEGTPEQRPYVTGAVVRDVDLSDGVLESILQLQEKLHATMGRGRAKGAIGIHDMTMLKGAPAKDGAEKSIRYTSMSPDERFVPLESDEEMTPAEVLDAHHMGSDYADLVAGMDRYPAIYDDIGLFSFPPVINGRRTEVTEDSRDLLIEMTGTDQWTVDHMLNIVCYALSARGGRLERVEISYDEDAPGEYAGHTLDRPDLATKTKTVTHDRIETVLGVGFDEETIVDCAERSGLDVRVEENYEFEIPPYRVDVLHPVDVIDDIGRVYGFNELGPRYPDVATVGTRHERSRLEDAVRETMVGLGFEDLLNFYMTNERENFERLGVEPGTDVVGGGEPVTIIEPYSEAYTMLRTWALPSVMQVLENNTHRSYPQHLAEIGLAACVDESENTNVAEHRTVALAMADPEASYEDVRARLQALTGRFDAELETPATEHPSFIPGRCAAVVIDGESVGVVGEVHPEVIVGHDIEVPVVAAEFRLDALQ